MIKSLVLSLLLFGSTFCYDFMGTHYMGDYTHCDARTLSNNAVVFIGLWGAAMEAGATVIKHEEHVFPGGGCTICLVLQESHATIHTYPEYNSCFVDFFTCGNKTHFETFHKFLTAYLGCESSRVQVIARG